MKKAGEFPQRFSFAKVWRRPANLPAPDKNGTEACASVPGEERKAGYFFAAA
jgi:hypothetical protein